MKKLISMALAILILAMCFVSCDSTNSTNQSNNNSSIAHPNYNSNAETTSPVIKPIETEKIKAPIKTPIKVETETETEAETEPPIDPAKLIKINMPSLPLSVFDKYSNQYLEIENISAEYEVKNKNSIYVTITYSGTVRVRDYCVDKIDSTNCYFEIYKENNVLVTREYCRFPYVKDGDPFSDKYTFDALIDDQQTPREFTISFSDYGY